MANGRLRKATQMASDWIKWTKGLSRKREVRAIAHKLNLDRRIVATACMEFWEWADSETCDGHIQGVKMADIDDEVSIPGFADALESVGWLRCTSGGITIPNFDRHNGKSAKRRSLDSSRKSIRNNSASKAEKKRTREEKRREERVKNPPKAPPLPEALDTPEFRDAWSNWLADRKERGKAVTERAARMQLRELESLGLPDAIHAIEMAMNRSWMGIKAEWFRNANSRGNPHGEVIGNPSREKRCSFDELEEIFRRESA